MLEPHTKELQPIIGYASSNESCPKPDVFLNDDEQAILNSFSSDNRKKNFIICRFLAKNIYKDYWRSRKGITIDYKSFSIGKGILGQPHLLSSYPIFPMTISISHTDTHNYVLCSTLEISIGIDCEDITDKHINSILKLLDQTELSLLLLSGLSLEIGIIMFWSAKESLAKTLLSGMNIDPLLLSIASLNINQENCYESSV